MDETNIIELWLCEAHNVILKSDVHYIFRVDENCDECKSFARVGKVG